MKEHAKEYKSSKHSSHCLRGGGTRKNRLRPPPLWRRLYCVGAAPAGGRDLREDVGRAGPLVQCTKKSRSLQGLRMQLAHQSHRD